VRDEEGAAVQEEPASIVWRQGQEKEGLVPTVWLHRGPAERGKHVPSEGPRVMPRGWGERGGEWLTFCRGF
jgi:hypothetical protein